MVIQRHFLSEKALHGEITQSHSLWLRISRGLKSLLREQIGSRTEADQEQTVYFCWCFAITHNRKALYRLTKGLLGNMLPRKRTLKNTENGTFADTHRATENGQGTD